MIITQMHNTTSNMNVSIAIAHDQTSWGAQRSSHYGSQAKRSSWTAQGKRINKKLGPYTNSHPSAQIKALEMLNLGPSDVFFDLGCSDGKLLVMALQKAIGQEIEERCGQYRETNEDCLEESSFTHMISSEKPRKNKGGVVPLTLQHSHSAPASMRCSSDSLINSECESHRRNHSFGTVAVPHLMRNPSYDSQFDDILDDLSTDEFDEVSNLYHSSWKSASTPNEYRVFQDSAESPITPLISNRKVLSNDDRPSSRPPLSNNEDASADNDITNSDQFKALSYELDRIGQDGKFLYFSFV